MADLIANMQAVAGAGGGEATFVEDVFSTYLYEGNGGIQGIENSIKLGDFGVGTSTNFDGSSYLSRNSALIGNSNGKTFTFSCWVKDDGSDPQERLYWVKDVGGTGAQNIFITNDETKINIGMFDGAGNASSNYVFHSNFLKPNNDKQKNVWNHILVSVSVGPTTTARCYLNDTLLTEQVLDGKNANIGFVGDTFAIMGYTQALGKAKLAHFYLDYTYRDLSVEANRRIFIDANGGSTSPSSLSALSPILYLPMTDAYTIGKNLGTGGDFTANGSPTIVQDGTEYVVDSGNGGLVWIKNRTGTWDHALFDTEGGVSNYLKSNSTAAYASTTQFTSFNSNGFSLNGGMTRINDASSDYTSWTFRKAPKFFDVVTYTGTGSAQTISHNLGSTPGVIITKSTTDTERWSVHHRSATSGHILDLSETSASFTLSGLFSNIGDTSFDVGTNSRVNSSGQTFVAYLFAHNNSDGEYGDNSDQDIIKCGSYTGNGSSNGPEIDLGFEPQWILIKNTVDGTDGWVIVDNMRGMVANGSDQYLTPNASDQEYSNTLLTPTATGFKINQTFGLVNGSGEDLIYIAIRRGPMKTPTLGTEVFAAEYGLNASAGGQAWSAGFPVDMHLRRNPAGSANYFATRMMGDGRYLVTNENFVEASLAYSEKLDNMDGIFTTSAYDYTTWVAYMWKRAPGFFDVVCFDGTGAVTDYNHNLGVVPEMIWVKERTNDVGDWAVWHKEFSGASWVVELNRNAAKFASSTQFNSSTPTSSVFTLGTQNDTNGIGDTYVACLFASVDGVSKVGSYEGNGSSQTIDCGFANGASFVLIKNIDSLGNWYVFDDQRGIVAGNDPYHFLDTSAAHVTTNDSVDPDSSGFIVNQNGTTNLNGSGSTYIFLAIA